MSLTRLRQKRKIAVVALAAAGLTVGTVVIVGALPFPPALLLGPVVQGLTTQLF